MKLLPIAFFVALLGACSTPHFVGDAPPVPVTSQTPDHFELPARFAVARVVYGRTQAAGVEEEALWKDLAERSDSESQKGMRRVPAQILYHSKRKRNSISVHLPECLLHFARVRANASAVLRTLHMA